jgi:N-acetylmuramoyl-L-alanine amidase
VLGLHANNRNFQIAKKENSVIFLEDNYESKYEGFDPNNPESIISLVLMQEDYLNQSIEAASFIQNSFVSNLKRKNRTVKQAGFLVLRNTYMPSVLVELGFLTNKKEGAYLNSKKGQNEMSNAIAKAIINYKKSLSGNLINNSSNESNKIELNNNLPIVYKIQISASTRKIELKSYNFKGLNNLTRTYSNSLYRYYYGEFNTYSEAKSYLSFVKKKGYKGAYIKAFRNGIEININSKMKKD